MTAASELGGLVRVLPDPQALAETVAGWISTLSRSAAAARGEFSIALAGGSTPRLLYETLGGAAWRDSIDWASWRVYFGDERACPADDPQSNYHLARTTLLDSVPIDRGHVHRMPADRGDLDTGAAEYSALLAATLPAGPGAPRLDCVLLGLGENGHTASLFPGTAALLVTDSWAARGVADYAPFDRITLTFPAINAARAVGFLVSGAAKRSPLEATARGETPASRVRPIDGELVWFLDEAAAG